MVINRSSTRLILKVLVYTWERPPKHCLALRDSDKTAAENISFVLVRKKAAIAVDFQISIRFLCLSCLVIESLETSVEKKNGLCNFHWPSL